MGRNKKLDSICFNLLDSNALFFNDAENNYGGAEVRGVTIAKELARMGTNVSVVVSEFNNRVDENIDNVRVISNSYYSKIRSGLLTKVIDSLFFFIQGSKDINKNDYLKWRPFIKANSNNYAAFEITSVTKNLVDFCKFKNKDFILFIASDGELSFGDEPGQQMNVREELAHYIINSAKKVFVQNDFQLQKLKQYFNISGVKINNPLPLGIEYDCCDINNEMRQSIVWIGKSSKAKQPVYFKELAKRFPEHKFVMIMNLNDQQIHDNVLKDLPTNIQFIESLPFFEVNELIKNTKVFINTSLYEGFPNTFLQAAYYKVPIISLSVNPSNFLNNSGGGICCDGSHTKMAESLSILLSNSEVYSKMSENIHEYVLREHSTKTIVNKILEEL